MGRFALGAAALAGLCAARRGASAQDLPPSRCAAADVDVRGTGPDTLFLTAGLGPVPVQRHPR